MSPWGRGLQDQEVTWTDRLLGRNPSPGRPASHPEQGRAGQAGTGDIHKVKATLVVSPRKTLSSSGFSIFLGHVFRAPRRCFMRVPLVCLLGQRGLAVPELGACPGAGLGEGAQTMWASPPAPQGREVGRDP
ncbi:hypothetical protein HJG60_010368 [Phyllostomus discolor]|uniref:Uncharacterized protein n=1 Tax=Phyllostomus discolor TaxID=89673 RepID=A0A834AST5_9CHIR|nr:hypothetical protein HJG60_010368 [Phyllostomus discolor]